MQELLYPESYHILKQLKFDLENKNSYKQEFNRKILTLARKRYRLPFATRHHLIELVTAEIRTTLNLYRHPGAKRPNERLHLSKPAL